MRLKLFFSFSCLCFLKQCLVQELVPRQCFRLAKQIFWLIRGGSMLYLLISRKGVAILLTFNGLHFLLRWPVCLQLFHHHQVRSFLLFGIRKMNLPPVLRFGIKVMWKRNSTSPNLYTVRCIVMDGQWLYKSSLFAAGDIFLIFMIC